MKRHYIYIAIGLFALSAIVGWWRASVKTADHIVDSDRWARLVQTPPGTVDIPGLNKRLKAMDIFPLTGEEDTLRAAQARNGATEENSAPPFPKIINVSRLDNKSQLVLLLEDNSLIAAYEGETLASGWQLKTVDLTRVIAVFDGDEREIPVTEYDDRQNEDDSRKSEDL